MASGDGLVGCKSHRWAQKASDSPFDVDEENRHAHGAYLSGWVLGPDGSLGDSAVSFGRLCSEASLAEVTDCVRYSVDGGRGLHVLYASFRYVLSQLAPHSNLSVAWALPPYLVGVATDVSPAWLAVDDCFRNPFVVSVGRALLRRRVQLCP